MEAIGLYNWIASWKMRLTVGSMSRIVRRSIKLDSQLAGDGHTQCSDAETLVWFIGCLENEPTAKYSENCSEFQLTDDYQNRSHQHLSTGLRKNRTISFQRYQTKRIRMRLLNLRLIQWICKSHSGGTPLCRADSVLANLDIQWIFIRNPGDLNDGNYF